jgi:hypothetical protein
MALDQETSRLLAQAREYASSNNHRLGQFVRDGREPQSWLSLCIRCGMRAAVRPEHGMLLEGAATTQPCDENQLRLVEARAWMTGEVREMLWHRLQQTLNMLPPEQRERYWSADFQPQHYRLVTDDGTEALQWLLRAIPNQPIHESNRQSRTGIVQLETLIENDTMRPALYIGELIDPNEPEDDWPIEPLQTGELGVAYQDDLGRWRFKREDGLIGFFVKHADIEFVPDEEQTKATEQQESGDKAEPSQSGQSNDTVNRADASPAKVKVTTKANGSRSASSGKAKAAAKTNGSSRTRAKAKATK